MTTKQYEATHYICGIRDAADAGVLVEAYRLASQAPRAVVHGVHVIDAEGSWKDLGTLSEDMPERRAWLESLHRRLVGKRSMPFDLHFDVELGEVEPKLLETARRLAGDYLIIGGDPESGRTKRLIEQAPCTVVVARPNETPDAVQPIVDAPSADVRREDARSRTHVYEPTTRRETTRRAKVDGTFGRPV